MAAHTLAVIFGNRDFFPDQLVGEARRDLLALFESLDIEAVVLGEHETKLGAVETWQHAQACADLFRKNRDRIEGVLVCLPNFGDEKGIADVLRLAALSVPVLVQACPDDLDQFNVQRRRDAFCGKISVCNNLRQYGIPFTLTERHTIGLTTAEFKRELSDFVAVCRVVRGMKRARVGAIGARPNAFNTTRYSEKLFERSGISVSTLDLSEVLEGARRLRTATLVSRRSLRRLRAMRPHPGCRMRH
jgi:L-fucose isomerase-like protein